MNIEEEQQPFLPRVGMIWFFAVAALVACVLGVVRIAEQGQSMAAAAVFLLVLLFFFFSLTGIFFVFSYSVGAVLKEVEPDQQPTTPFSDGSTPPEQLFPPRHAEDV